MNFPDLAIRGSGASGGGLQSRRALTPAGRITLATMGALLFAFGVALEHHALVVERAISSDASCRMPRFDDPAYENAIVGGACTTQHVTVVGAYRSNGKHHRRHLRLVSDAGSQIDVAISRQTASAVYERAVAGERLDAEMRSLAGQPIFVATRDGTITTDEANPTDRVTGVVFMILSPLLALVALFGPQRRTALESSYSLDQ